MTERIRLNALESRAIKTLEDHAGVLWIVYTSGNGWPPAIARCAGASQVESSEAPVALPQG